MENQQPYEEELNIQEQIEQYSKIVAYSTIAITKSPLQNVIQVPQLCRPQQYPFKKIDKELALDKGISQDLKQTIKKIHQQLNKEFKVFNNAKHYTFILPQSKFPSVPQGQRNMISYEQKSVVEEEDTFRDKLSQEQIYQIRQDGQFKVRSNREYITLPYIWKINQVLLIGKNNIQKNWYKGVSNAFGSFYFTFNQLKTQIPNEMQKLTKIPIRIFSLIFGKRKMNTVVSVDYPRQIAKQFWTEVMDKYYYECKEWGSQVWQYFYVDFKSEYFEQVVEKDKQKRQKLQKQKQKQIQQYTRDERISQQKKQKFAVVHSDFQSYWPKIKKRVFAEVSQALIANNNCQKQSEKDSLLKDEKANDEKILQAFDQKKFNLYVDFIKQNLPKQNVPNLVIQSIITLITIFNIFNRKTRKLQKQKKYQNQKIRAQIKQKHKIKSLHYNFFETQFARIYNPIQKTMKYEFYKNLYKDKELQPNFNVKQKAVYQLWLEFITNYDARLIAKKNQIKQVEGPNRVFYSTYLLLPPYNLIKNQNQNYTSYALQKQKGVKIGTDTNFWKFKLYAMRLKCWTINCVVFLLYCSWTGPFGLRCLFGIEKFRYEQYLANYQTGQIGNNMRKPFIAVFLTVLQGIKKSRQNFEALPDRGLFGKNFSRYFNYVECYLFRFLIVGVVINLILYPIAIVAVSLLCAFFILTIWFWSPLILLATYLFNIIIFQFQSSYIPYGFFIRSVPLLSLAIFIATCFLKVIFYVLSFVLLAPIVAFFYMVTSIIARYFRTVTDFIMITLISKLGRTPSRNSAIAKKISGPGMSRQFYMSITEQDVYVLTQAQLQRMYMQQFDNVMRAKINEPINRYNKTMNLFLKSFMQNQNNYYGVNNSNCIFKNVNDLLANYSKTYQNYISRFPNRPYNVRFTQQELDIYLDNSSAIVKNFVHKMNLKNWVFEHYQILQDWDQLTRKIWVNIFQCGQQIFQPLQKIDTRFKLQDQFEYEQVKYGGGSSSFGGKSKKMRKQVNSVMNALEGEVQLSHKKARVSPFRHSLMNQQFNLGGICQLVAFNNSNSKRSVYLDFTNPKTLFSAHLNLKELCKNDDYQRTTNVGAAANL